MVATVGSVVLNLVPQVRAVKAVKAAFDIGRATVKALATVDTVKQLANSGSEAKKSATNQSSSGSANPPQNPKNNPKDPKDKDKDKPKSEAPKSEMPKAEKKVVHFGQNPNQSRHTFRHTEECGLRSKEVKLAVEKDLGKNMQKIDSNKSYKGTAKVNGIDLEYNAQEVASGKINIGKITVKKK